MKKGDLKRDALLAAAERLFVEKGYEGTSIQDIIDVLSLSKGGFYHYFPSKEAILQAICENRIEERFEKLETELSSGKASPMDKLNAVLRLMNLFERETPKFAAVMLKIAYLDGDVQLRERMRSRSIRRALPLATKIIDAGVADGTFFVRHPNEIGFLLLSLTADVDDEAYRIFTERADDPECIVEVIEMLKAGRDAAELLLNAPFASIRLFDPAKITADFRAMATEIAALKEKK